MTQPNEATFDKGPEMQSPVSGSMPIELAKRMGIEQEQNEPQPQAQATGQPEDKVAPGEEKAPEASFVNLGLDESDYSLLSTEERQKIAPIMQKIERGVAQRLETASEYEKKAAAWDAALSIPAVVEALENHLGGGANPPKGGEMAKPTQPSELFEVTNDLGDLDGNKLQAAISHSIESTIRQHIGPLKQDIEALRGHVAKTALDAQFETLAHALPGLADHRAEIMDMLAKGEVSSIEAGYDRIQGRLYRQGKLKAKTFAPPPPSPEENKRATVVSERAGPAPNRLNRTRTIGMADHLASAMSEMGVDGFD